MTSKSLMTFPLILPTMPITSQLINQIKQHYGLDWYGTHGVVHWSHVYENGMRLAAQDGVNRKVVALFSVFHDSRRLNEGVDDGHGPRGAGLAGDLRDLYSITDQEFDLLQIACRLHTVADTHRDITVQACFDADRLDLGRVGNIPDPRYLCTPLAKEREILDWAYNKSLIRKFPCDPFGLSDIF
ncbi:hypothetical protein [Desulfosediminicola sp.]|uniref:hypothetical protein n=1 Tax=Desulfosediminicola sp. TaxID=2886825 RepID=UPI003AF26F60